MRHLALAAGVLGLFGGPAHAAVPGTVVFSASLTDDRTGDALEGEHSISFQLYPAQRDGRMMWNETHDVVVDGGRVQLQLGARTTLDADMLGDAAFLAIHVDGVEMSPRLALASVPYAMKANMADEARTVGGLSSADLQQRVKGSCGNGEFMKEVRSDGTVVCEVEVRVKGACAPGQLLSGIDPESGIACSVDQVGIASMKVGAGLSGSVTNGTAELQLDTEFADSRYLRRDGDKVTGTMELEGDAIVRGAIRMTADYSASVGPEIHYYGNRGAWLTGIDVANNGGSRDFVLAGKVTRAPYSVEDFIYLSHNGEKSPTFGVGVTPPNNPYRLQVSAADVEPEMGSVYIRKTPHQIGDLIGVFDSAGVKRWWLDSEYWFKGASNATGASVSIKADDVYARPLMLAKANGSSPYGFEYSPDSSGSLNIRSFPTGMTNVELTPSGKTAFPNGVRIGQSVVPASASSPCTKGDVTYSTDYVYVCIATNTWRRSALEAW
jgi:hypothetical protein